MRGRGNLFLEIGKIQRTPICAPPAASTRHLCAPRPTCALPLPHLEGGGSGWGGRWHGPPAPPSHQSSENRQIHSRLRSSRRLCHRPPIPNPSPSREEGRARVG